MSLKNRVGEFLQRSAEYEQRAALAHDFEMRGVLRDLAEQYRRLAAEAADDPYCTRETRETPRNKKASPTSQV
jgi:hypothetical protein